MPKLKIVHVETFSSEDPVHVANNLLSPDPSKKWKCQNPGDKSANVVLKLETPSVISGIDIGNENSAYIEVLVTRSGSSDDYKVLLVMSSFMTPLEARQSVNTNKVRMFTTDNLSKPECEQKWDKIKIVCTQPFNRHVQYGLSFIILNSPDDKTAQPQMQTKIGQFTLRPDSPDKISVGSLFARNKEEKQKTLTSIALAAKKGEPLPKTDESLSQTLTNKLKVNRASTDNSNHGYQEPKARKGNSTLYFSSEDDSPDETVNKKNREARETQDITNSKDKKHNHNTKDKTCDTKKKPMKNEKHKNETTPDVGKNKVKKRECVASTSKRKNPENITSTSKRSKVNVNSKPFNRLLEGVILVVSGIQNPQRSTLRNMAISMGAKYKADWDHSCTHLICAFPNTPKFKQVQGKGKIVTSKWIEECHNQRKRLPWRRYCLDRNDKGPESEEEICEQTVEPDKSDDDDTDIETRQSPDLDHMEGGSDTEERISLIINKKPTKDDPFSADTEPEDDNIIMNDIGTDKPKFKNLFTDKIFYIDTKLSSELYKKVNKYVVAYNGNVVDDPTDEFDVCITDKDNAEEAKLIHPDIVCLKPDWVWEVHNKQVLVPFDEYIC